MTTLKTTQTGEAALHEAAMRSAELWRDRDLAGYATFAVTVEAERVDAPTTTPVILGDLTAS